MSFTGFVEEMRDLARPSFYSLHPYLVRDGKKHPFALIAPGGGYLVIAAFKEGRPVAEELNKLGYHAFVLYYSIRDRAAYPGPQTDLEHALREIFAHANDLMVDTEGYSLWGFSAGGHLVSSFCTEDRGLPLPAALALAYPVVTMDAPAHKGSKKRLLGRHPEENMIRLTSVEKNVTESFPATYIWNGTADKVVDPENARMLEKALKGLNVPCRADVFPNVGHGVGLAHGTEAEPWFKNAVAFWEEHRNH